MYNDQKHTLLSTTKNIDCKLLDVAETVFLLLLLLLSLLLFKKNKYTFNKKNLKCTKNVYKKREENTTQKNM